MGKVIFWILVVFAVLFLLRLYNFRQMQRKDKAEAKRADGDPASGTTPPPGENMVRCARCGIFLPRSEALLIGGSIRCRDRTCAHE